ncbi:MAG: prolyl aminopeptidase [Candidatus Marinimicrobia bacterium]|nr:prolyl aminopeptidase [Candidatus Neomarinimicrobiota bacterium]
MRDLYPAIEPYNEEFLKVSDLHTIHYEECGNPEGQPVLFVHGGPGGGIEPVYRRYFDPRRYRIILVDQRGSGKSTPHAELRENTTQNLVADMEQVREQIGVDKWLVFGGSWGSTLGLVYAQTHPNRVTGLILRGIFMCRPSEIQWFYQSGASQLFPDRWEAYLKPIPEDEQDDLLHAYYRRLTGDDHAAQAETARAWSIWEGTTSKLRVDESAVDRFGESEFALAFARIECHYFVNNAFLEQDQILRDVPKIKHISAVIVQGRYDVVCPMRSAWDLHRAWPEARFQVVPDAGHSITEPGIRDALIEATDRFGG